MRQLINKYAYPIAGAVLVLVLLLVIFRGSNRKPDPEMSQHHKAFYIDEETGQESVRSAHELPPLLGKDGKFTLVRAYKFTADGGRTEKIVYLEKYSDQAIQELKTSDDGGRKMDILDAGPLIRLPGDGNEWVPRKSPAGERLIKTALNAIRSDGGSLEPVYPK
ncbi:MAG: hypothetical protein FWD53_05725 [Phycisphaerales bacterium]|nr:hypothetical protein [Phycisphaerales bacterium]